jgi:hypothetical protein
MSSLQSLGTMVERRRWLNAVIHETRRPDPNERWANDMSGDYQPSFHPTRELAETAALKHVASRNEPN